jgi:hypothetical protein
MKITSEMQRIQALERIEEIKQMPLLKELEELYDALESYDVHAHKITLSLEQVNHVMGQVM